MLPRWIGFWAVFGSIVAAGQLRAEEAEPAPWNFTPLPAVPCGPKCKPFTPTMFGDQLQMGGFQGGFNQGGFQGGFNQGGFQGGFNQGGFQGGFNQGGFQGGFNQGGFQGGFNQGGGGFNKGFGFGPVIVYRGAFKIAENESPRPQDRLFATYNYYDNVRKTFNVHRETFGFEKTLFGDDFSVGVRVPTFQILPFGTENASLFGDLNIVLKYAFVNRPDAVISGGLVIAAPTGPIPAGVFPRDASASVVHPTVFQPFAGYYWGSGDFFVHGFSSVMVPTDSEDVTQLYNDIGVGYRLTPNSSWLLAVVPTFEVHVNTPLNHRHSNDPFRVGDSINLTAGTTFFVNERVSLGVGVGVPVTGPKVFDVEALANLNWRF